VCLTESIGDNLGTESEKRMRKGSKQLINCDLDNDKRKDDAAQF